MLDAWGDRMMLRVLLTNPVLSSSLLVVGYPHRSSSVTSGDDPSPSSFTHLTSSITRRVLPARQPNAVSLAHVSFSGHSSVPLLLLPRRSPLSSISSASGGT